MVKNLQRYCVIFLAVAVFFSGAASVSGQDRAAPVVVAKATQGNVRATVDVVGTVRPNTESTVAAETSGLVETFPINRGDFVKQGQLLCKLKDTDLKLMLAEAQATFDALKQALGELEAGTRAEDLARIQAATKEAAAVKDKWDREKVRIDGLYKNNAASIKEYNDTISDWVAATERLAQAQAELEKAVAGPRKQVIAASRARVAAQQAVIDQIKDKLSKTRILAPYTGYITEKKTERGQWVMLGGPVLEMLALDPVLARVDIPEKAFAFVKPDDSADVWIDALQAQFSGKVAHIIPQGDAAARTFPIEIEIANGKRLIKPGMFVRAKLPAGPQMFSVLVPKDALVRQGTMRIVYVVRQGRAAAEFIQTGLEQAAQVSIFGNVKAGDLVVIRGNERLAPIPGGMPVTILNEKDLTSGTSAQPASRKN